MSVNHNPEPENIFYQDTAARIVQHHIDLNLDLNITPASSQQSSHPVGIIPHDYSLERIEIGGTVDGLALVSDEESIPTIRELDDNVVVQERLG